MHLCGMLEAIQRIFAVYFNKKWYANDRRMLTAKTTVILRPAIPSHFSSYANLACDVLPSCGNVAVCCVLVATVFIPGWQIVCNR